MPDTPHLMHGQQRITTDRTLKADLQASLDATSQRVPPMDQELRRALALIDAELTEVNERTSTILDTMQELIAVNVAVHTAARDMIAMVTRIANMAQEHILEEEASRGKNETRIRVDEQGEATGDRRTGWQGRARTGHGAPVDK